MNTYRIVYEWDAEGKVWGAEAPAIQGCHTQGNTLDQARENIREALSLYVADAYTAQLQDEVHGQSAVSPS